MKFKITILLAVSVLSSGCAQYQWQKYGSTQMDFNRDSYACQTEAARVYPPQFITQQITQGYTTPSTTNCYGTTNAYENSGYINGNTNTNCTTMPGQHIQGVSTTKDANSDYRNEAAKQCMYSLGWQLIRVK